MSSADSITAWIGRLRAGEAEAAQRLWERYFQRLAALARRKLRGNRRLPADEEDVALSALDSFFRGAASGRYPQLHDRDNLWALLVLLTARKARAVVRREAAQKRGGGKPRGGEPPPDTGLDQIIGREPTPAFAAQVADECQRLLESLRDPQLEAIARWRMEGYNVEEIAEKIGYSERSIKRKLQLIRSIWEKEGES